MEIRRQFTFGSDDKEFLDANFPQWESIQESQNQWLLIHDFDIPNGYTLNKVTVAINIPSTYPPAPLDMAYFHPHIIRADGRPIGGTQVVVEIDRKSYQRWSRHYTTQWDPGCDSLQTHIIAIGGWLEKEQKEGGS